MAVVTQHIIYFGYNADITYLRTITRSNIALLLHKLHITGLFLKFIGLGDIIVYRVYCAQTSCCLFVYLFFFFSQTHYARLLIVSKKSRGSILNPGYLSKGRLIKKTWRLSNLMCSWFLRIYLEHVWVHFVQSRAQNIWNSLSHCWQMLLNYLSSKTNVLVFILKCQMYPCFGRLRSSEFLGVLFHGFRILKIRYYISSIPLHWLISIWLRTCCSQYLKAMKQHLFTLY